MSTWFTRVGLPLTTAEEAAIGKFVRKAIPHASNAIDALATWPEAVRFLRLTAHDPAWWDQEEAERELLWEQAAELRSEAELLQHLAAATLAVGAEIREAALASMTAAGIADAGILREATESALLAAHQCALAQVAGVGADHRFVQKNALFAGGRWPLGYHSARFAIF